MSNRDKLAAAIAAHADATMREEIAERVAIWNEDADLHEEGETFDDVDAFIDLEAIALGRVEVLCNRILIEAGFYVPVTDADLARTVVSRGARKYDLAMGGVRYRIAAPLVTWLDR